MESSEGTERRSERKRKRKESYSPEGKKEGRKKKLDGQTSQNKSRVNRPYDVLPNGEPFSCHLCKCPYVVNPISKGVKKTGRSRHTPVPKIRTDTNTGREMILCNACVQIFDRPQRRVAKAICAPTEEEKKDYLMEVDFFITTIKREFNDPLVEKLFCPMNQKKLCGCLQKYIQSTGNSHVPVFVTLMKEALELRKEKSYPITDDNKKVKLIGLGNGHKKSKRYEEFVLSKRRVLKDDMRLCERATQKVLMYSNNFLHKRLKTENRPCRVERTRGKAALGQLPEFQNMMDLHCCSDHCVMLALTHKRLLQDWRDRALQGQLEARRVMAEMLTPAGATHINCYSFISMVTGCSQTTIARVYNQMINTGGDRDPPEHGMKRVWQDHYKQTKTSEGTNAISSMISTDNLTQEVTSTDNLTQEVTSSHRLTNQYTATLDEVRQHKVAMMQDLAKTQQQQQQQLAVYLQDLMSAKNKQQLDLIQAQSMQRIAQLQHKPGDITQNALMKAPNISIEQLQQVPSPALLGIHPSIAGGQGHLQPGHGQTVTLQPPPQYGVNQSSITRQWNQSQFPLPVNVSQSNYILTGDQQVVPVIPVFKHGSDCLMVPSNMQVVDTNNQNINQPQPMQILSTPLESVRTSEQGSENQNSGGYTHEMAAEVSNVSKVQIVNQTIMSTSNLPQGQVLRQYQILTDQGTIQFQVPSIEPLAVENAVGTHQSIENSTQYVSVPGNNIQNNSSNPNLYFHILPENTVKIDTLQTEQSAGLNNLSKKPTVSIQNCNSELIAQPMPVVERNVQNHQAVISDVQNKQLIHSFQRKGDRNGNKYQSDHFQNNNVNKSINQTVTANSISTSTDVAENIKRLEHSSTIMQDSVSNINQVDHTSQPVNQSQLIVPVSLIPASHQNETGNEQVPSQIQISLETYPTETNQPSFTQQIILPHGNVVTLPLMSVTNKDIDVSKSQLIKNYRDTVDTASYSVSTENGAIQNLSRENLQLHVLNQKDNTVDSRSNTHIKKAKSRNSSGNSKKSRNSSGSSEKSRKSVHQFSSISRNETHQELGHSSLRPEHLTEGHFVSKLNKSRHRQFSGNSEYGDRSRKSSGNSMISETSSQISGLTLSNLASPNIFLDKDKGIFFIQSMDGLEFNEIDSNHLADFIQAVEADQTDEKYSHRNQSENIRSDSEIHMLNQSGLLEAEIVNKSRRTECEIVTQSGRMGGNIQNDAVDNFETQSANLLKFAHDIEFQSGKSSMNLRMSGHPEGKTYKELYDEKHNEDKIEQISDVRIHSQARSPEKRKSKEAGKKHAANKPNKPSHTARFNKNENYADTSIPSSEDCVRQNRSTATSTSFVPIAPKGAPRSWSLDAPTVTIDTRKTSHNTPILSSLLARQPMYTLYE